jgi:hypothetical protein
MSGQRVAGAANWSEGRRGTASRAGRLRRGARLLAAAAMTAGLAMPALLATPDQSLAATLPAGGVVAWGDASKGKTDVPLEASRGVVSVAAGCNHSLALKSDGSVIAWGDDTYGQTNVPAAARSRVIGIVAGCNHSLALRSDGKIVAWGDNSYGQTSAPPLDPGWQWTNIAAGAYHSTAIARYGSTVDVAVFGDTSYGQADVPSSDSDSYYDYYWNSVGTWGDLMDVEAGGNQTMGRMRDGSVIAWGGTPSVTSVPSSVRGVVWMSMGSEHALVVRSDGTVVAWGENDYGQTNVPASVRATKVAAGGAHSLALLTSGQVVAWGRNNMGQTSVPALREGSRFAWIAAGQSHSLAVELFTPAAPRDLNTVVFNGAVTVSWSATEDIGSLPLAGYVVTSIPEGKTCKTSGGLTCTVGGLTDGTPYAFTVAGIFGIGTGPASDPTARVIPGQPGVTVPPEPTEEAPTSTPPGAATEAPPAPANGGTGSGGGGLPLLPIVGVLVVAGVGAGLLFVYRSTVMDRLQPVLERLPVGRSAGPEPVDWMAGAEVPEPPAGEAGIMAEPESGVEPAEPREPDDTPA